MLQNVYHTDLLLCWMVVFPKTGGFCPEHQNTSNQSIRGNCSLKGVSLAFLLSTVNTFEIQEKSYKPTSTIGFQLIGLVLLFPPLCCWVIYRNKILSFKKKIWKYSYNIILASGIQHSESIFLQVILHLNNAYIVLYCIIISLFILYIVVYVS